MLAMEDIVSMTREFFSVDVNPEMSRLIVCASRVDCDRFVFYVQVLIKAVELCTSRDETSKKQLCEDLVALERYSQNYRIASMVLSWKQKLSCFSLC